MIRQAALAAGAAALALVTTAWWPAPTINVVSGTATAAVGRLPLPGGSETVQRTQAPVHPSPLAHDMPAGGALPQPPSPRSSAVAQDLRAWLEHARSSDRPADLVRQALTDGDASAMAVAWWLQRSCEQALQWDESPDFRRALNDRATTASGAALRKAVLRCSGMPTDEQTLAALQRHTPAELLGEGLRRAAPLPLQQALATGDAEFIAAFADAAPWPELQRGLQHALPPEASPALAAVPPQDLALAVALAACPAQSGCPGHPILMQACAHSGACNHVDLLQALAAIRPPEQVHALLELARWLPVVYAQAAQPTRSR